MTKQLKLEAIYVRCRQCGFQYLEEKDWLFSSMETECESCKTILTIT